jgi:hypothetical protein
MEIEKLIGEIIPPIDRDHREGFTNEHIVDKLTATEKKLVEHELIRLLENQMDEDPDYLIIQTLAYLKSVESLPVLKSALRNATKAMTELVIAASIFEINNDNEMTDVAISAVRKISKKKDNLYTLIFTFFYLAKFKSIETNKIIEEFAGHKEYLVSYNAKRFLSQ